MSEALADPHGVSLGVYAAISAELAEGRSTAAEVLGKQGILPEAWEEIATVWTQRLAADAMEGGAELSAAYAEAFVEAQDALAPPPSMTVEEWAKLSVEVSRGDRARALASRGLTGPDHLRLSRHWARALSGDRALAHRYAAAFHAEDALAGRAR